MGYKHIDLSVTKTMEVIYRYESSGEGALEICGINGKKAKMQLQDSKWWRSAEAQVAFSADETELQLVYHGSGAVSLLMIVLKVDC